jgi:two-component system, OmpR family, response regulator
MTNEKRSVLFLVDDDAVFLKMLEYEFLEHTDYVIKTYSTGELCIQNLSINPDAIILDYHLNGIHLDAMNGLKTLDLIKSYNKDIPVIILSSQDSIEVAIDCMHHHASDYIVKSETAFFRLQQNLVGIFNFRKMEKTLNWYMEKMCE